MCMGLGVIGAELWLARLANASYYTGYTVWLCLDILYWLYCLVVCQALTRLSKDNKQTPEAVARCDAARQAVCYARAFSTHCLMCCTCSALTHGTT
jgi:hypothetical protein